MLPVFVAVSLAAAALVGCHPATHPAPPRDEPEVQPFGEIVADEALRVHDARPRDPVAIAAEPSAPPQVCVDDRRIRACRIDMSVVAHHIGLAIGHDTVAVAAAASGNSWVRGDADGPPSSTRAQVIVSDRALRPIGEASIAFDQRIRDVALVETADGWLLAAGGDAHIELVPLDARGREVGPRGRVDGAVPRLVKRPGAGPLLVFVRTGKYGQDVLAGAVVGVDLRGAATIFENTTEPEFGGQIALDGGAALIARRGSAGVSVARLGADGRRGDLHTDFGGSTEYPSLAACADGPRMIWSEFGGPTEVRWARLDGAGSRLAGPVRLSGTPDHFNFAPAVCDGADTLVALTGYTGGTGLSKSIDLVRVDAGGQRQGEALRVASGSIYDPELVSDAEALFVAWVALGDRPRVALARVDRAVVGAGAALVKAR